MAETKSAPAKTTATKTTATKTTPPATPENVPPVIETPTTTSPTSPPVEPLSDETVSAGTPEQLPDTMRSDLEAQRDRHNDPLGLGETGE